MYECVNPCTHTHTIITIEATELAQTVKFLLHNHEELNPYRKVAPDSSASDTVVGVSEKFQLN